MAPANKLGRVLVIVCVGASMAAQAKGKSRQETEFGTLTLQETIPKIGQHPVDNLKKNYPHESHLVQIPESELALRHYLGAVGDTLTGNHLTPLAKKVLGSTLLANMLSQGDSSNVPLFVGRIYTGTINNWTDKSEPGKRSFKGTLHHKTIELPFRVGLDEDSKLDFTAAKDGLYYNLTASKDHAMSLKWFDPFTEDLYDMSMGTPHFDQKTKQWIVTTNSRPGRELFKKYLEQR